MCILIQAGIAVYIFLMFVLLVYSLLNKAPPDCGYLLVPGTSLDKDRPFPLLEGRLLAAQKYIAQNGAVCVVSGEQVNDEMISEGEAMLAWFKARGIEVIPETGSRTTLQNFLRSLPVLKELGFDP